MGVSRDLGFPLFQNKMAAAQGRPITFEETELLSFLCQNVVRKLCEEAEKQGLPQMGSAGHGGLL